MDYNNQLDAEVISPADSDITPTRAAVATLENKDFFSVFKMEVWAKPFLTLLTEYLMAANGSRKSRENVILDFRIQHPRLFSITFLLDFVLRLVYLAILLFLVLRGLGIIEQFQLVR